MLYVIDVSSFSFSLHTIASCLIGSSGFLALCLGMPVLWPCRSLLRFSPMPLFPSSVDSSVALYLLASTKTCSQSSEMWGFCRNFSGNASHCHIGYRSNIAKKCLHSSPVWQKSGQVHLGMIFSEPKERSYQTSSVWDWTLKFPPSSSLMCFDWTSLACFIRFSQWFRKGLGLLCRYLGRVKL